MTEQETPEGMQAVNCQLCGAHLGWQEADTEIDWSVWCHSRCPERVARAMGLTRDQVELLTVDMTASIAASFPDIPNPNQRIQRARIAAEHVLERFIQQGWKVDETPQPDDWKCVCTGQGGAIYSAACPVHDPNVDTSDPTWRKWYDDHLATQRQLKERLGWS